MMGSVERKASPLHTSRRERNQSSNECLTVTPLKTNMSPKNQWLEDAFPIEIVPFFGDMLVFGGVSSEEKLIPPINRPDVKSHALKLVSKKFSANNVPGAPGRS